jgi:hypothetical protein
MLSGKRPERPVILAFLLGAAHYCHRFLPMGSHPGALAP